MSDAMQIPDVVPYVLKPMLLEMETKIIKLKLDLRKLLWGLACRFPLGFASLIYRVRHYPPQEFYTIETPLFPPVMRVNWRTPGSTHQDVTARLNFVWKYFGNCDPKVKVNMSENDSRIFWDWVNGTLPIKAEKVAALFLEMESLQEELYGHYKPMIAGTSKTWHNAIKDRVYDV